MNKSDIVMVYAEGRCFVGQPEPSILKKAIERMLIPTSAGLASINQTVGDLQINFKNYPHTEIKTNSPIYAEYVKITTGIEIPAIGNHSH